MSFINSVSIFYCLIVFSLNSNVIGDLITSPPDMVKLLDTERALISSLDDYLAQEELRLRQLKIFKEKMSLIESIASKDVQSYLSNPYNAFILIKTVTRDWNIAKRLMVNGSIEIGQKVVRQISAHPGRIEFPTFEDFKGAIEAMLRLQSTYQLDPASLSRGEIKLPNPLPNREETLVASLGDKDLELTAGDCFELGRHAGMNGNHQQAILWMREALNRYERETLKTADKPDILEHLAFITFNQGDIRRALQVTNQLIEMDPEHPRAHSNKEYFEQLLAENNQTISSSEGEQSHDDETMANDDDDDDDDYVDEEIRLFESLCRGENRMSPQVAAELSCYYLDTSRKPYLRYSRIKVEEAFKKPLLQIFHDVMYESEIERIKQITSPKLERARIMNATSGETEIVKHRTNKITWLKDSDDQVVDQLSRRIKAITGLNMDSAEDLQVGLYGVGGHYVPHFDFSRPEDVDSSLQFGNGNRFATWLIYMSDVEAGGATVFPVIGVSIFPRQGSALFWYNLHENGAGDYLTRHGACPVLLGSKWIATKWFRERGQDCGLTPDS